MRCQDYKEMISAHVDGALSSEERLAVRSHLDGCPKCTQMFHWETQMRTALKRKLSPIAARPALKARVLDQLEGTRKEGLFGWPYMAHGLAAAFALLIIVTVPYLSGPGKVQKEIFTDAIASYQNVMRGVVETPQTAFPAARLLDLSPWGYRLLSEQTRQVKGQEERVFVYRGRGKEYLLAQEFEGGELSSPPGGRVVRVSSQDFVSYSQAGVNLVAWKQKGLLCIIASTLPKEKLLGLAQQIAIDT
jgi:anti-sigma factor (TIGR02949 family)